MNPTPQNPTTPESAPVKVIFAPGEPVPTLLEFLRPVEDPEMFISIVDLGLVYEATIADIADKPGEKVGEVVMTLTSPHCPIVDVFVASVKKRVLEYPEVTQAEVKVVFEPKWDPATMASDEVKDRLGIW